MPENFGFMVSHPVATVAPTKLEDYKVASGSAGKSLASWWKVVFAMMLSFWITK